MTQLQARLGLVSREKGEEVEGRRKAEREAEQLVVQRSAVEQEVEQLRLELDRLGQRDEDDAQVR